MSKKLHLLHDIVDPLLLRHRAGQSAFVVVLHPDDEPPRQLMNDTARFFQSEGFKTEFLRFFELAPNPVAELLAQRDKQQIDIFIIECEQDGSHTELLELFTALNIHRNTFSREGLCAVFRVPHGVWTEFVEQASNFLDFRSRLVEIDADAELPRHNLISTPSAPIRLLGSTNNSRGDLFTRLTGDFFYALGYDNLMYDVAESGCEIDLQGEHRLLPRRMIAECKANAKKIGGEDLQKFVGAVALERSHRIGVPIDAFFVSLNGFRESGKKLISKAGAQDRVVLLDGQQVIDELTRIRIVCSEAVAAERAGRCVSASGIMDLELNGAELIGHPVGYVWTVYYSRSKQRTHYALIHADGTPLAPKVAQEIRQADQDSGGSLHALLYLRPPVSDSDLASIKAALDHRYRQWVVAECGDIQLDGLPADADLSVLRMRLEGLFVPLKVIFNHGTESEPHRVTHGVGSFLESHPRISILAKPGGGKTTLLKRLAVAYADTGRQTEVEDKLPARDWVPLLIRCRELKDRAHRQIRELLDDLPRHAGISGKEAEFLSESIDDSLRTGNALLLIDGLDEISDVGARTTFVSHLRTFVAMFPSVSLVVTSREAGYRHIAGVVAGISDEVRLAPFDQDDVRRLCVAWHLQVVGDNPTVRRKSEQLALTIWQNERIRALAENPLMLTTLLVVERWVGELPTKRVDLYRESVKVLVRTWNIQGFAPMDLEETQAQLSYVACVMMNEGIQQISLPRLVKLLHEARAELQAELQFTNVSPADFIERVEYRSSLLMQTGHVQVNGELQPIYEFRHLTFQEYLAARGFVEEQYPGRDSGQSLVELLEPHFDNERWREVIPLAAVIAGRKAERLIRCLTSNCEQIQLERGYPTEREVRSAPVILLRQCLLDEVQITPATVRTALRQLGRLSSEVIERRSVIRLRRGRFGDLFQEVVEEAFLGTQTTTVPIDPNNHSGMSAGLQLSKDWDSFSFALSDLCMEAVFQDRKPELTAAVERLLVGWIQSGDRINQARAFLIATRLAYLVRDKSATDRTHRWFRWLRDGDRCDESNVNNDGEQSQGTTNATWMGIASLLSLDDPPSALAASWALVWMGRHRLPSCPSAPEVISRLYRLWCEAHSSELRRFAEWAIGTQPLLPRGTFETADWEEYGSPIPHPNETGLLGELVTAWYRRSPWTDSELAEKLKTCDEFVRIQPTWQELAVALGVATDDAKAEEMITSSNEMAIDSST